MQNLTIDTSFLLIYLILSCWVFHSYSYICPFGIVLKVVLYLQYTWFKKPV